MSFRDSVETGNKGETAVSNFLKKYMPDCKLEQIITKEEQRELGDYYIVYPDNKRTYIEIKTEEENKWGNLFLEEWSNKKTGKLGWMRYSLSHLLFYHFLKSGELYIINLDQLQRWAYDDDNIKQYNLKLQKKCEQSNDTWGYCVPIEALRNLGPIISFQEIILDN